MVVLRGTCIQEEALTTEATIELDLPQVFVFLDERGSHEETKTDFEKVYNRVNMCQYSLGKLVEILEFKKQLCYSNN